MAGHVRLDGRAIVMLGGQIADSLHSVLWLPEHPFFELMFRGVTLGE
jgi:hypothetical protein